MYPCYRSSVIALSLMLAASVGSARASTSGATLLHRAGSAVRTHSSGRSHQVSPGANLTLAAQDTVDSAVTPAASTASASAQTISGTIAGLSFTQKTFWVNQADGSPVPVLADQAGIHVDNQDANIYRLIGSPRVTVHGSVLSPSGLFMADSVSIDSGLNVKLQESAYTGMAQPAFPAGTLTPLHAGASASAAGVQNHSAVMARLSLEPGSTR
jgi:hypothetical protein